MTEGSNLAWNLPKHPQDSPPPYLLRTLVIFHNFLTFSFSEGRTQSGHRRWCVNRSHLTQSRLKPLENLRWQETSRIWISPEVQTDPSAEWLLAGPVLCTIVTVRTRDWLTIASEVKTEVLADVPGWLLGTERPDVSCPGPNSHRHSWALSYSCWAPKCHFLLPCIGLGWSSSATYICVWCLLSSFFWNILGFQTSVNNVLTVGKKKVCFLHVCCMADNVNPKYGENS